MRWTCQTVQKWYVHERRSCFILLSTCDGRCLRAGLCRNETRFLLLVQVHTLAVVHFCSGPPLPFFGAGGECKLDVPLVIG